MNESTEMSFENASVFDSMMLNNRGNSVGLFDLDTEYKRRLKITHDVIVMFTAGSAMFAIGCDISVKKIKEHLKLPRAAIIGLLCQFILMPAVGYTVVNVLKMDPLNAAGVIILCCAPGGGYSNLLSYLTQSDVSLSALLTTLSSVISLALTPLNLWIYGRFLEEMKIIMPYEKIVFSLAILQAILVLGMFIRFKFMNVAVFITKIGVLVSVLMLICRQIIAILIKPDFYQQLHWKIYAACSVIPAIGLLVPFITARCLKESPQIARTLSLETAIQSIGTSFTIVFVSFSRDVIWEVQQYIALYSDVTCTGFLGLVLCFHAVVFVVHKVQKKDYKYTKTSNTSVLSKTELTKDELEIL